MLMESFVVQKAKLKVLASILSEVGKLHWALRV